MHLWLVFIIQLWNFSKVFLCLQNLPISLTLWCNDWKSGSLTIYNCNYKSRHKSHVFLTQIKIEMMLTVAKLPRKQWKNKFLLGQRCNNVKENEKKTQFPFSKWNVIDWYLIDIIKLTTTPKIRSKDIYSFLLHVIECGKMKNIPWKQHSLLFY